MRSIICALTAALSLSALPVQAQDARVEIGLLECVIDGGTGYIIGSTKDLSCAFSPADSSRRLESYFGVVRKFGLDLGTTGTQVMQWAVFAPTEEGIQPGALAGDYIGATAEATVGVGAGANILIGGSDRTFTLQPLSVQAQTGLNIALGISEFQLRSSDN